MIISTSALRCGTNARTLSHASGIGLESALLFAQEGADVLLVDVNLPAAEKALALIQERSPNVKAAALKADVGKEADVKAAVDKAVELFGRLDVMVRTRFPARARPFADGRALGFPARVSC